MAFVESSDSTELVSAACKDLYILKSNWEELNSNHELANQIEESKRARACVRRNGRLMFHACTVLLRKSKRLGIPTNQTEMDQEGDVS